VSFLLAVVNEIVIATQKMQSPNELSISFMQVGDDSKCGAFFRKLEKSRLKSKYAIVDTMSYSMSHLDYIFFLSA
jgi:hypothetical protein